jgi:two-component system, cell cycle sensor histidine kinase and response regulator CckA
MIMPGCGGPELISRLRAQAPALRVLYMSGYTDQSAVLEKGICHGLSFVQKPFKAAEFVRRVREALDQEPPPHGALGMDTPLVANDESSVRQLALS